MLVPFLPRAKGNVVGWPPLGNKNSLVLALFAAEAVAPSIGRGKRWSKEGADGMAQDKGWNGMGNPWLMRMSKGRRTGQGLAGEGGQRQPSSVRHAIPGEASMRQGQ
ncbi:hypothetical protein CDD83_7188 [Cordyceps sp. RAO-2017]|nr:hypothetical protein CDD83_7188 [Cordyceps sp. RAO-2017]